LRKNGKENGKRWRYPWETWFAGPKFSLQAGVDFDCMPHGMGQMVRNRAFQLGKHVKVRISETGRIDVEVKETVHA